MSESVEFFPIKTVYKRTSYNILIHSLQEVKDWIISQKRELQSSFRFFVVITGFNDNDNMLLVVELVVVFVVNFAMNKMRFRVMKE